MWMLQRGHSGEGCVLALTLCKYDLRKGDLFVLSWSRVRRVGWGSISSELQHVCCGDCVGVCGNVCCVAAIVKNSVFLALEC